MVMSDKCPNENTSRLGSYVTLPPCASGGMYCRVPGKLVSVSGFEPGSRSIIRELPILCLSPLADNYAIQLLIIIQYNMYIYTGMSDITTHVTKCMHDTILHNRSLIHNNMQYTTAKVCYLGPQL